MRRWVPILLFVVCIVLSFVVIFFMPLQADRELRLVHAFQKLHIAPTLYVLHYGSELQGIDQQQGLNVMHSLQKYFHLPLKKEDGAYIVKGRFRSFDVKGTLLNNKEQPYLSLQVSTQGAFNKEILNIKKQLGNLLRINKQEPHFHFSIQGQKQDHHPDKLLKDALYILHAKEVESLKGQTVSVSAYSSLLGETIKTAGGPMNVQIALRAAQGKNQWMVTMGTPIITIEY